MSVSEWFEVQCDGLVGPSHHYGGLSHGNVASLANAQAVSHPKKAALQGLEKMAFVASLGIKQLVLPPHPRPNLELMRALGASGEDNAALLESAAELGSALSHGYSSAHMWAANMATVSPAVDTLDGKLHMTPANLASSVHRAQEAQVSYRILQQIFGDVAGVDVHPPLPACVPLTDEGAANHMRLAPSHGDAGVEIFVYGRVAGDASAPMPTRYPARQTLESVQALQRSHGVADARSVVIQQQPDAIDAGVFHNDVIAMSNGTVLIYHEAAFCDEQAKIAEIADKLRPATLVAIRIREDELPISVAVKSYFFNSQLVTLPDGTMVIVAPKECEESPEAAAVLQNLRDANDNPIRQIYYLDVRESMRNGGGPACLRLRVAMDALMWQGVPVAVKFTPELHSELSAIIEAYYPEKLTVLQLRDSEIAQNCAAATREIWRVLGLNP